MKRITLALAMTLGMFTSQAQSEQPPNEFGYFLKKSDTRNISSASVELRFCSLKNCPWQRFTTKNSDIWALKSNPIDFSDYLEAYLKSQSSDEHFFFINKEERKLIYSTLYGHREEVIGLPMQGEQSASPEGGL